MKLNVFSNANVEVRAAEAKGEVWFVAKDVCRALGIKNNRDALTGLDDDERGVVIGDTLGGQQEMAAVNESGLYHLVFVSRKAEARAFRKWVTSEVLPAIRRTGGYEIKKRVGLPMNDADYAAWREAVNPFLSKRELCVVAEMRGVSYQHVRKMYDGRDLSGVIVRLLTEEAKRNRENGVRYRDERPLSFGELLNWFEDSACKIEKM